MEIEELGIAGLWKINSPVISDERGSFREWFKQDELIQKTGKMFSVRQANLSKSSRGSLRGIHFSLSHTGQAKLVTCASGAIWEVVVDLRTGSPTFKKWVGINLEAAMGTSIVVSEGLGHGFLAMEENSIVTYLLTSPYSPLEEFGINPMDPELDIEWPIDNYIFSKKDQEAPSLSVLQALGKLPKF